MQRELDEELGIEVRMLVHKDFFLHPDGKLVLAYVGRASMEQAIRPESEWCKGKWVTRDEFKQLEIGVYKDFTLAHWPVL